MFGRPTPTKQTCWPASARAAATIIISDLEKVAVAAVTGRPRCRGRWSCRAVGHLDHPVGALGRRHRSGGTASQRARTRSAIGMEDLVDGILECAARSACSISGSANHSPITGRWPRRRARARRAVIASTFAWIRAGSPPVPDRYGPATRIISGRRRHRYCP